MRRDPSLAPTGVPLGSEEARVDVPARLGLLGNPSDGYGGRVIACTVAELCCTVTANAADQWDYGPPEQATLPAAAVAHLDATIPDLVARPAQIRFETTIPREVGLSGSSAIIIGVLRALADLAGQTWDPVELARTALEVETDRLGWAAGPQDRVIQAHGGLMDMDFASPWSAAGYRRLDPGLLPEVFVAWDERSATSSDAVHSDVRDRWLAGDAAVREGMARFAALAAEGRQALESGRPDRWPDLLDEALALRRRFWVLAARDDALIAASTAVGAGVSLAGSGGAVVGVLRDPARADELETAIAQLGASLLWPTIGQPA